MARMKPYDELEFVDDFVFCKVMRREEICKKVIELILGVKIKSIRTFDSQHAIELTANGKGVRLDVIVDDDEGTIYNIEMQTSPENEYGKRSRYYQGMIDLETMSRGCEYSELRKCYVIFLCLTDPFRKYRAVYTFENRCVEDLSIRLKDEAYKVVVNPFGRTEGCSEELKSFLGYLRKKTISDTFTQMLDDEVKNVRAHEEWRAEYMLMGIKLREAEEKAKKEGLAEGRAEGRAEGHAEGMTESKTETAKRLAQMGLTIDQIVKAVDASKEDVQKWITMPPH